jgi:hypothetical protein
MYTVLSLFFVGKTLLSGSIMGGLFSNHTLLANDTGASVHDNQQ